MQGLVTISHWGPSCTKARHWAQGGGCFLCCAWRAALSFGSSRKTVKWGIWKRRNTVSQVKMLLIPAAAQLHFAKSTRCQPRWLKAGKFHGSRSSEGIWLRFCREKHERKMMWNKMMLGRWSGWSGWRGTRESAERALMRDKQGTKQKGKNIRSLSPLQFNFFTVWWWGFKPKHEWVNAAPCVLVSGCPCAADMV